LKYIFLSEQVSKLDSGVKIIENAPDRYADGLSFMRAMLECYKKRYTSKMTNIAELTFY